MKEYCFGIDIGGTTVKCGLFNVKGVENIREVQKIAVEQSRLKIPLLFGMDVIHGLQL